MRFGRWASRAFREYVREAVLGINGGDMSRVVEGNNLAKAAGDKASEAAEGAHGFGSKAKQEFVDNVLANPLSECTGIDLEARWRTFAEGLAKEVKAAAARPLPPYCMSESGVVHKIVDCSFTACGWHWTKFQCRTTNSAIVSCKKCSGTSLRWGDRG